MAGTDAIAFFGDTLRALLQDGLAGLGLPANGVQLSTPDDFKSFAPQQPAVTIFLYHVSLCGERRNVPRRTLADGAQPRRPLPLELRFLVTPWTTRAVDGYRLIGAIARLLYDHTLFDAAALRGTGWAPDDTVELMLESLPVEQHYDIWEPTGIPYRLSLSYLARLVDIDSAISTASPPILAANFAGGG